jgi:copper homeostasis protein
MYQLEICANSVESAIIAQQAGAQRIELCTNLAEGGTTPSYGQIKWCVDNLSIPIWPLIRPRGGDFLYSNAEFDVILEDINFCKEISCDGIVIGILLEDGSVDISRCSKIIDAAHPMPVSFHRAFDMTNNLAKSLEDLIDLGFIRVLTSGGKTNARLGANQIAALVKQAKNRIEIMPGAGINTSNIAEIATITSAKCFHTTAKALVKSEMQFKNNDTKMSGDTLDEFVHEETNLIKVKELINLLNTL